MFVCCLSGAAVQWDEEHISYNFDVRKGPISVEWFKGGTTNICYNALDRHVAAGETCMTRGDRGRGDGKGGCKGA